MDIPARRRMGKYLGVLALAVGISPLVPYDEIKQRFPSLFKSVAEERYSSLEAEITRHTPSGLEIRVTGPDELPSQVDWYLTQEGESVASSLLERRANRDPLDERAFRIKIPESVAPGDYDLSVSYGRTSQRLSLHVPGAGP